MDIFGYIDAAMRRTGCKSKRQLSKRLGLNPGTIFVYEQRRALPSDATMERLAELAGVPIQAALLDLCQWRTAGQATERHYRDMALKLARIAAVTVAILGISAPATSRTSSEQGKAHNIEDCILWQISY